jgi:NAD+ kinase
VDSGRFARNGFKIRDAVKISQMTPANGKAPFNHIAVLSRSRDGEPMELANQIAAFLSAKHLKATASYMHEEKLRTQLQDGRYDLVIALGGDGTMLRAGHFCAPLGIPLLGINQGHFGFLIELEEDQWREALPRLATGEFRYEERMLIHVELWRGGKKRREWEALNEALVGRGSLARPVHVTAILDGRPLTTYVADGLIIASATGSTAYALASGGPILPPQMRNMVMVPVAPHLSMDRAIVLDEGSTIRVELKRGEDAVLSVDGQQSIEVKIGAWVDLRASQFSLRFLRFQEPGYFYQRLLSIMDNNPSAGMVD